MRKMTVKTAAIIGVLALLTACGSGTSADTNATDATATPASGGVSTTTPSATTTTAPQMQKVKIGVLSGLNSGTYLLTTTEFLRGEGVDVEWVTFNTAADEVPALLGGSIDMYEGGVPPSIILGPKAPNLWMVGVSLVGNSDVIVAKDSGIASFEDLKGKDIAYPGPGSQQYALLTAAMQNIDSDIGDLNLFGGPASDTATLLEQGQVQAVAAWPPFTTEPIRNGIATRLATAQQIFNDVGGTGGWLTDGIFSNAEFAQQHPEAVTAVLKAIARFQDLGNNDPDQLAQLWTDATSTPIEAVQFAINLDGEMEFPSVKPDAKNVEDMANIFIAAGLMDKPEDMNAFLDRFVHPEFAEALNN